jgi:hypothetical protein
LACTGTVVSSAWMRSAANRRANSLAWLADQPAGRFEFVFTPTHGAWLNLVEGFFSKLARSVAS